jgi:hypothetical protein
MQDRAEPLVQITFYYLNGQSEIFVVPHVPDEEETNQDSRMEFRHLLQKEWWVMQLEERTVMINMANVAKVEVTPPLVQQRGEGIFLNAERITALNRGR